MIAPSPSRHPMRAEQGFTLIELLVVILIIGILSAVAVPVFLSQNAKAHDSSAKSDVTNVAKLVESCRVDTESYTDCDQQTELKGGSELPWGTGEGDSGVMYATDNGYFAYSISKAKTAGKNHVFVWQKDASGVTTRLCLNSDLQALNSGGCSNSGW